MGIIYMHDVIRRNELSMEPVRIFNLRGNTYKYERKLCAGDNVSTKTLSILEKDKDGKDVFNPIIMQSKYGENAFSYENYRTGEVLLADNFRTSKVFDVTRRVGNNCWKNTPIGSITENQIDVQNENRQFLRLLKKMKAIIKNF